MSRLISAAATMQTLSLTAMEEASRGGERTAGVDHLFLALMVTEQTAGQVLRSIGITLPAAREAVAAQHDAQLASLGIRTEAPAPGGITFHETHGYEWGEGALAVIRRSSEGGRRGDAAAVLRELLDEPSGFVEAVLQRLGTTPESVRTRLDEAEGLPFREPREAFEPGALSGKCEGFAPATASQVWEMLADPARMPEWEPGIGSVEDVPPQPVVGTQWTAHALRERPDGSPLRVRPQHRTARVEITACEAGRLLEWSFT
ncbi:SRPBCC family protein [Brevibacterium album]|uniref:SRPBCC family protein n=1 Tax=Brevibacterium album TaxID=417948 RepID=UPI000427444B|nr:Clp protease N-terminal domain-containing protein [Brevibacterium album]